MLESDKKKQYSNNKVFFLTVNHCMLKDTYSLYTMDNHQYPVLQRFSGYAATDSPGVALQAAKELYSNGYNCRNGHMPTYAAIQRLAAMQLHSVA